VSGIRHSRTAHGRRGSALLLALVVLLTVTMLGLSLTLVTDMERRLGANQRGLEQALWAAESGLALAAARVLTANDLGAVAVDLGPALGTPGSGRGLLRNRAEVASVRPLLSAPCGLCQINGAGSYSEGGGMHRVHLAIEGVGSRVALSGDSTPVLRRVEVTLDLEPWVLPGAEIATLLEAD
jgi:hypothetical protein